MNVFISWSGPLSKQIAELLSSWLEDVLQGTKTWLSSEDIDKGSLWFGDISEQLALTSVGILCLTRENISSPWILFEAGALSKGLSRSRVCPFLIDLEHADLQPPLSQFNGTLPTKDDLSKLTRTINAENGEQALSDDRLQKAFERWWGEFDSRFTAILKGYKPKKQVNRRSIEDMVEEILELTRSLQRSSQRSSIEPEVIIDVKGGTGKSTAASKLLEAWVDERAKIHEKEQRMEHLKELIRKAKVKSEGDEPEI